MYVAESYNFFNRPRRNWKLYIYFTGIHIKNLATITYSDEKNDYSGSLYNRWSRDNMRFKTTQRVVKRIYIVVVVTPLELKSPTRFVRYELIPSANTTKSRKGFRRKAECIDMLCLYYYRGTLNAPKNIRRNRHVLNIV